MTKTAFLVAALGSTLLVGGAQAQSAASTPAGRTAASQGSSANLPTSSAQRPAEPTGEGYTIWRNALFRLDDRERLRDGRADQAMRAARENVEAFQRSRAAYDLDNANRETARANSAALALQEGRRSREDFARARGGSPRR